MLAAKGSAGVAQEVNLRHLLCTGEEAHKQKIHPGFETQGRRHKKSKSGISVAPQKGLMFSKILKKQDVCSYSWLNGILVADLSSHGGMKGLILLTAIELTSCMSALKEVHDADLFENFRETSGSIGAFK